MRYDTEKLVAMKHDKYFTLSTRSVNSR